MTTELLNKIREKINNKKLFDNDILCEYIKERIFEEGIEDYIYSVCISSSVESAYNPSDNTMSINPNEILYNKKQKEIPDLGNLISKKEKKSHIINDANNPNLYNLFCINHELAHTFQNLLIDLNIYSFDELDDFTKWRLALIEKNVLASVNSERFFKDFYYKEYHDYFFAEYDADMCSYLETLRFIELLDIDEIKGNIENINKIIAMNLRYLYRDIENKRKISSPSMNFLKLHNHINKILIKKGILIPKLHFDIYRDTEKPQDQIDRLRLGFSVNEDTHRYLDMVSEGKHKTLNLFDDIRNI